MSRRVPRGEGKPGKRSRSLRATDARTAEVPAREASPVVPDRATPSGRWIAPLVIVAAGLVAYYNSFAGTFVYDDEVRIVINPQIRQLWPLSAVMVHTSRPLVELSLALNYALGGLDVWGYHALNLAVHVLAGLLLFGVVRRMLDSDKLRPRYGQAAPWLAGAVALIWSVHPLQTESVTYVIQRAESMMGMFLLLTLYCAIRGAASAHPWRWQAAAIAACALGMGSKEVMVVAPLVVLLYDRMFIASSLSEIARRRAGLYAGLAATWLILAAGLAGIRTEDQTYIVESLTPWRYALTQFGVIVHYLRLAFWPSPLVLDYAWRPADAVSAIVPWAIVVLALLVSTAYALLRSWWIGYWGAWFFLILAPTSSVYPIADAAFEHRMYLPLAAVVVLVVVGMHEALAWGRRRCGALGPYRGWLDCGLVAVAVLALAAATVRRNEDYRGDAVMWADVVAKRPDNPRGHYNIGVALHREDKPDAAITHFAEALRLKPDFADAHLNIGAALLGRDHADEALPHVAEAIRLKPGHAPGYKTLGDVLVRHGMLEQAIPQYSEAIRLKPDYALAYSRLGVALVRAGKQEQAIARFNAALRLDPGLAEARNALAAAQGSQGRPEEAVASYAETLRRKPDDVVARNGLGSALAAKGELDAAIAQYREALRLDPNYAEAESNLGAALHRQGKVKEAIAHFTRVIERDPHNAVVRNNLGAALGGEGRIDEATAQFAEAVRLKPDFTEARDNLKKSQAMKR